MVQSEDLSRLLRRDRTLMFREMRIFARVLTNLQYEGKASLGKNLLELHRLLRFFGTEVLTHVRCEDKCLFPYLESHIPRFEQLIAVLRSEHRDFLVNYRLLCRLERLFQNVKKPARRRELAQNIREVGTYLIYLLRSHMREEDRFLYATALRELNDIEKRELGLRIRQSSPCRREGRIVAQGRRNP